MKKYPMKYVFFFLFIISVMTGEISAQDKSSLLSTKAICRGNTNTFRSEHLEGNNEDETSIERPSLNVQMIAAEWVAGTLATLLTAAVVMETIPKNSEEDIVGLTTKAMLGGLAMAATASGSVAYIGYLVGDSGSFRNALMGSIVAGGITGLLINTTGQQRDWKTVALVLSLPVGAVIGYNLRRN